MSRHTKGPWVYARNFDENGKRAKVTTVAMCCDFVIGLPAAYEGGNYRDGDPSGDPEADARLIAAAPDLLEKLDHLVQCCDALNIVGPDVEEARAAIAKVEGGEA